MYQIYSDVGRFCVTGLDRFSPQVVACPGHLIRINQSWCIFKGIKQAISEQFVLNSLKLFSENIQEILRKLFFPSRQHLDMPSASENRSPRLINQTWKFHFTIGSWYIAHGNSISLEEPKACSRIPSETPEILFSRRFALKFALQSYRVYCEYNYANEHNFTSPEDQVLHFLARTRKPGWKWMSLRPRSPTRSHDPGKQVAYGISKHRNSRITFCLKACIWNRAYF